MAEHLIRFENVGPRRETWEARLSELTQTAMRIAILRRGAIMTRTLSVKYTPGFRDRGQIFADVTRVVGTFRILSAPSAPATPAVGT